MVCSSSKSSYLSVVFDSAFWPRAESIQKFGSPNCKTYQALAFSANNAGTQLGCKPTGLDFESNSPNTVECSTRPVLTEATIYQPLSGDLSKPV